MKTYRTIILTLTLLCWTFMEAQTDKPTIFIKSLYYSTPYKTIVDSLTNEKTIIWPSTENWVNDTCWVDNVPVSEDWQINFPAIKYKSKDTVDDGMTNVCWLLTEEQDETVLHCYLPMPGDVVTNLWLANDETAILDRETGIRYQARRSEPECWNKYFGVRANKDDILDFRIYFPQLPPTTRSISIYGVPNWYLRGGREIKLHRNRLEITSGLGWYLDSVPEFHMPRLIKPEDKYEKSDGHSWAVFTDAHLIKPVPEKTMALWLTPQATYLAIAMEQNWIREYFNFEPGTLLVDGNGKQYKLRELHGLPLEHVFWMEGFPGDYIGFVMRFDPLPIGITTITYYEPDGEPFDSWGANWKGNVIPNLDVQTLRENQKLFDYHPRETIK